MMKDGLLLVDKAAGGTSHDVVQGVRRIVGQKKVGHCGTLDPDATGLLVLTLGRATRLTRFLIRAPKIYEGVIRFGIATDTYDASGAVVTQAPLGDLSGHALEEAMNGFVGEYEQTTPPYSAKKVKGKKYYQLAREGQEVPIDTKVVTVFEFRSRGPLEDGRLPFLLSCSSGTYARSLAHELGQRLGCGGHLAGLRRTRVGPFRLEDAVTLDDLRARVEADELPDEAWIPFDLIPLPFPELETDPHQEMRLLNGQTALVRDFAAEEGDWVKLLNRRRQFLAVGSVVERFGERGVTVIQPKIVFRS